MKNKKERLDGIIAILSLEGKTSFNKLASRFDVSSATIRRDIKLLESSGQVFHTVGGEVIFKKDYPGPSQADMLSRDIDEKIRIAEYCSSLIENLDTIIIGPGVITTLAGRIFGGLEKKFRVITNSLLLAMELSNLDNISLFMLGGDIEKQHSIVSNLGDAPLCNIQYADKLFLTVDGIDIEYGLTYFDSSMIQIIRGMMNIAREIILIVDSTKFGNVCFNFLDDLKKISMIVTDNKIEKRFIKAVVSEGIKIEIV